MNYEFHVGDYVETRDGKVGYIYYFRPNALVFKTPDGGQHEISTDVLDWSGHPENVFKRIGAYDFTKKEKKKIEQLAKDLPVEGKLKDKTVIIKQYLGDDYCTLIYSTKMIDKINELVDAVNKLMDDYNKHIEAHRQTDR